MRTNWSSMDRMDSKEFYLAYIQFLTPEPDVLALVESEEDIFFWKWIFCNYARTIFVNIRHRFSKKGSGGKGKLVKLAKKNVLCEKIIVCLDSDYDNILQNDFGKEMHSNPFIFQTYAYSIENYFALGESLQLLCVQCTLNDNKIFDFAKFLKKYSNIIYNLFLYSIYFEKVRINEYKNGKKDKTFTRKELYKSINLNTKVNFANDGQNFLSSMENKVVEKENYLKNLCHDQDLKMIEKNIKELELGLNKNNVYLFIKGKYILNGVIPKIINFTITEAIKDRIDEYETVLRDNNIFEDKLLEYANRLGINKLDSKDDFQHKAYNTNYLEYLKRIIESANHDLQNLLRKNLNIEHNHCYQIKKIKKDINIFINKYHPRSRMGKS